MQGKHVVVFAGEDLVACLNDQIVALVIQPLARVVRCGGGLFQGSIRSDHLARNQVRSNTEMLERALGLRTPELVCRHLHSAQAIGLCSHVAHVSLLVCIQNWIAKCKPKTNTSSAS